MGRPLRRALGAIVFSLLAAVLTGVAVFSWSYLLFPVRGVQVEGERMFQESKAREAVSEYASLLTLNSEALERAVESDPWVKGAEMTKDWESGIVIVQVKEIRAVLDAELDGRRIILAADGTELPGLGGVDLETVEVNEDHVEEILETGRKLEKYGISLDSVNMVDSGGIEATVEGRNIIFSKSLTDGQVRALEEVMERNPEARIFDLRSPGRVVVGVGPDG